MVKKWLHGGTRYSATQSQIFKQGYEDPTYHTFRVEFGDWGASVLDRSIIKEKSGTILNAYQADYDQLPIGLLDLHFQNNEYNYSAFNAEQYYNAYNWLLNRNEDTRARYLQAFILGIYEIQKDFPYLFKSIGGLDKLIDFDTQRGYRVKDAVVTLTCIEGLSMKIRTLLELYRKAAWDDVYQRWILPENYRQFKMIIYVFERRMFHMGYWDQTTIGRDALLSGDGNEKYRFSSGYVNAIGASTETQVLSIADFNDDIPMYAIECCPCEFNITNHLQSNYDAGWESDNQEETTIEIKVSNVRTYLKNGLMQQAYNIIIMDLVDKAERTMIQISPNEDTGKIVDIMQNPSTGLTSFANTPNGVKALYLNKSVLLQNEDFQVATRYWWGLANTVTISKKMNFWKALFSSSNKNIPVASYPLDAETYNQWMMSNMEAGGLLPENLNANWWNDATVTSPDYWANGKYRGLFSSETWKTIGQKIWSLVTAGTQNIRVSNRYSTANPGIFYNILQYVPQPDVYSVVVDLPRKIHSGGTEMENRQALADREFIMQNLNRTQVPVDSNRKDVDIDAKSIDHDIEDGRYLIEQNLEPTNQEDRQHASFVDVSVNSVHEQPTDLQAVKLSPRELPEFASTETDGERQRPKFADTSVQDGRQIDDPAIASDKIRPRQTTNDIEYAIEDSKDSSMEHITKYISHEPAGERYIVNSELTNLYPDSSYVHVLQAGKMDSERPLGEIADLQMDKPRPMDDIEMAEIDKTEYIAMDIQHGFSNPRPQNEMSAVDALEPRELPEFAAGQVDSERPLSELQKQDMQSGRSLKNPSIGNYLEDKRNLSNAAGKQYDDLSSGGNMNDVPQDARKIPEYNLMTGDGERTVGKFSGASPETQRSLPEYKTVNIEDSRNDRTMNYVEVSQEKRTLPKAQFNDMERERHRPTYNYNTIDEQRHKPNISLNQTLLLDLLNIRQTYNGEFAVINDEAKQVEDSVRELINETQSMQDITKDVNSSTIAFAKSFASSASEIQEAYQKRIQKLQKELKNMTADAIRQAPVVAMTGIDIAGVKANQPIVSMPQEEVERIQQNIQLVTLDERSIKDMSLQTMIAMERNLVDALDNTLVMNEMQKDIDRSKATDLDGGPNPIQYDGYAKDIDRSMATDLDGGPNPIKYGNMGNPRKKKKSLGKKEVEKPRKIKNTLL